MGKLKGIALLHTLPEKLRVLKGLVGKGIFQLFLLFIEYEIDAIIHSGKQNAPLAQNTEALLPDGKHFLHIAVGDRVENELKGFALKGEGFCHIGAQKLDGIAFLLCKGALALQLFFRIIEHRAFCPKRRKNRHLLGAARCKAEQPTAA